MCVGRGMVYVGMGMVLCVCGDDDGVCVFVCVCGCEGVCVCVCVCVCLVYAANSGGSDPLTSGYFFYVKMFIAFSFSCVLCCERHKSLVYKTGSFFLNKF